MSEDRQNEKVHELLIRKAERIRSGAEVLVEKTRDWQVIKEFMCNRHEEIELTPQQQKKLDTYQFINNQLSSGRYTLNEVATQVNRLYKVSLPVAYEYIRHSKELFSAVIFIDKQFEIKNEIEIAKQARQKCMEVFDFKAAQAFGKLIKDLLALLPDEENHPGEDFEGHTIEAVFNPALLGAPAVDMKKVLAALNEKRAVKINIDMFPELDTEEVDDGNS